MILQNFENFWWNLTKFRRTSEFRAVQKIWKFCRTRKTLQNEYLVAKIGVDIAENGPSKDQLLDEKRGSFTAWRRSRGRSAAPNPAKGGAKWYGPKAGSPQVYWTKLWSRVTRLLFSGQHLLNLVLGVERFKGWSLRSQVCKSAGSRKMHHASLTWHVCVNMAWTNLIQTF